MTVRRVARLRGAGAVRARRRRGSRPRSWCGSCACAAIEAELVSVPFKWYPKEEILPHAAAWRLLDLSESNGRPIDLRHRHQVPDLLRAPPEQGRLADPPVPRRLRAVRHRVQRLRAHRARRRPARHADAARHGDARRVPRGSSPTRANTAGRLAKFNGLARRAAVPSAAAGAAADGRARTATTSCRSAGIESVKRVDLIINAMAARRSAVRLVVAGDGTQRANVGARRRELPASPIASRFSAASATTT